MVVTEKGIKVSFANVKRDVRQIQAQLLNISGQQAEILKVLQDIRGRELELEDNLKKVETPRQSVSHKKTYVASKTGKSFHITSCPFAKNIKPKSKLTFKTKDAALNKGLKPCECVK